MSCSHRSRVTRMPYDVSLGERRERGSVTATIRWFFLAVGVSAILVVVFLIVSGAGS